MKAILHGSQGLLDALDRSEPETELTEEQQAIAEEALKEAMKRHEQARKNR